MNTEREKTDALSDAVEIDNNKPEGATHRTKARFYCFDKEWGKWFVYRKTEDLWECVENEPRNLKPI